MSASSRVRCRDTSGAFRASTAMVPRRPPTDPGRPSPPRRVGRVVALDRGAEQGARAHHGGRGEVSCRSWRACTRPRGGTAWMTGGSVATSVRADARCTRGSADSASCASARGTASSSRPTAAPPASASTRSRRSRLNHFLPGTSVLSFGTAGCNLACRFCQNWDISKSRDVDTLAESASPEAVAEMAEQLGCRSVAFTYNDPVIFLEYAIDVADACRARGHPGRRRDRRLRERGAGPRLLRAHGRGQRRPEGIHRALLPRRLRGSTRAGPRDARASRGRDRRLVRAHHARSSPA